MKLGTETGSMTNHLYSRMVVGQPQPHIGMGATLLGWTDRHAATIIDVRHVTTKARVVRFVTVQRDFSTRTDSNGMSESQTWAHRPNPDAAKQTFRDAGDGVWQEVCFNPQTGRWSKCGGDGLRIGERSRYHDFSF